MRIESLKIHGFRGISELSLDFSNQINVIVGINGAGKSAILDCTAILLSRLLGRIRSSTGTGRFFSETDINNSVSETQNSITLKIEDEPIYWRVTKNRRGTRKQYITGLDELKKYVEATRMRLEEDELSNLPLAVYYPVNRAVLDIPLRIRTRHRFERLSAYDQALSGSSANFRIFFEWFREREDLENEYRVEKPHFRDSQLQAVRTATERFLPGFMNLKVRRSPLRMVVEKNQKELLVNQLSDGEKCTLAMVGDLARRMATANPHMSNPLEGEAIVLIDEADLHLHPAWQRRLVTALRETFPNCQFLLSTHSPALLSHLQPTSIWILDKTEDHTTARQPEESFGQTVNRILEDIMGVSERPEKTKMQLSSLFQAITEGELNAARRNLEELRESVGVDPDLTRADILIRRKEMLG